MRVARLATVVVSVLAATGTAAAQSWEAKTELRPDSKSTCPKAALIYEFTVAGSELTAKPRGGGHALTGSVSADGRVSIHNRTPALGQVIISGNARSRELQATSSNYPGCIYAFQAGDMNAGLVSAYQGNVGDWALGRWDGRIVGNFGGVGIREYPRSVMVVKLPDGRIGCRYGGPDFVARLDWTPKCTVTANGISLATLDKTSVELTRADDRRMEGRVREASTPTAYTAFFARTAAD